jgi:hypothetical protein
MSRTAVLVPIALGLLALLPPHPARSDDGGRGRDAPWLGHLRTMDRALQAGDVRTAERAWREAYLAALGIWEWDGMADVADASVRLGRISGPRPAAMARARNLYLAVMFRARSQRSVEGILRAASGFVQVGDRAAAEHAVQVAEGVAAEVGDAGARARIQAFAATLASDAAAPPEARP